MLTHTVDLCDAHPAFQEAICDGSLICQRETWRRFYEQRRSAAHEKKNHLVIALGFLQQLKASLGCDLATSIGNRVACGNNGDASQWAVGESVPDYEDSLCQLILEQILPDLSREINAFANSDDKEPPC